MSAFYKQSPQPLGQASSMLLAEVADDKYHFLSPHFFATLKLTCQIFYQVYELSVITLVQFQGLIFTFLQIKYLSVQI